MNCIFLDKITPEMKTLFRSEVPEDMDLLFWDEIPEDEREVNLAQAESLLTATYRVDDAFMQRAPKLKIVQKMGVGTDNIDLTAAAKRGIVVGNVPGGNANGVAELTMGLILEVYRKIRQLDKDTRNGVWSMWKYRNCSYEIKGKKYGIIGFGDIGKRVAELSKAFGATLYYYSRTRASAEVEARYGVTYLTLEELLTEADIVSIHVPLSPTTRNWINAEKLKLMKKNAVFINVSRGNVVNEQDLYEILANGKILGAAIDVWATEPVNADNPLLTLDNVVATPHVGSGTVDTVIAILRASFQKIRSVLTAG
ncbi:2-hydroxyacid dehydrogenase [Sporomusa acidovorans]|uniref:Glyoxylate/hydroxypyruvate reductase B n=1 Tax=Sporomusa acidovorans (strain ATCC 49682 / DSM 3132 / Mol) TaxID=1123286 RepID=A0ABZ3IZQ9_SPOA4|nr:2-hydroxyacid dehydrogenase [Sporomusa acidovorans]OZC18305.1 hydroxypyruvate reductase [Sporomusa acidovorans DSM 3132]SDF20501.1 D-3-phosphoglycerate dehydrogenase [Sporomusa acidovorans]